MPMSMQDKLSASHLAAAVARGSWMVTTSMGGWPLSTVHPTRREALKAAGRPSDWAEVWQGDFAQHKGGWVSSKGRRFLRTSF